MLQEIRRKKILKFAKGFKGAHSRLFRTANGQVMKALIYSYVGRKRRKQDFKKLWICRVNAAARNEGLTYSKFKKFIKKIFDWFKFKNVSTIICFR